YKRSNAAASPCWASRIASASGISPGVSIRLVRATLPVGTHPYLRCVSLSRSCTLEFLPRNGNTARMSAARASTLRPAVQCTGPAQLLLIFDGFQSNVQSCCSQMLATAGWHYAEIRVARPGRERVLRGTTG